MSSKRRVVVTGLGMISPLGNNVSSTWEALLAGKSGVGPIEQFDASRLPTRFSASVRNFDPEAYGLDVKEARKFDTFILFAYAAAKEALEDSGLEITEELSPRAGVAIGSGMGGLPILEKNHQALLENGPRRISPFFIPGVIINMASGFTSIKFNLKGPNIAIVTACTTGAHNIGHAARMISYGDADIMVAGGSEMATTELAVGGFNAARALSTRNDDPQRASRPWDKDRDGFVLGDGAGVIILEEYEFAKKRGAKIYAELVGFGMSGDAYHITAPGEDGMYLAMKNTLQDAGIKPEDVDYINAHGTSTPVGDVAEAVAIKRAFGDQAYKIPVSSTKSMTGHLLGAAGSVEAIISILAMRNGVIPPTINLDNPGEGCDLDFVPKHARQAKLKYVMSNSFGFGGTNGSLIFTQP